MCWSHVAIVVEEHIAIPWNIPGPVCNPLHWHRALRPAGEIQNIHASALKTVLWQGKDLPGSPSDLRVAKTN